MPRKAPSRVCNAYVAIVSAYDWQAILRLGRDAHTSAKAVRTNAQQSASSAASAASATSANDDTHARKASDAPTHERYSLLVEKTADSKTMASLGTIRRSELGRIHEKFPCPDTEWDKMFYTRLGFCEIFKGRALAWFLNKRPIDLAGQSLNSLDGLIADAKHLLGRIAETLQKGLSPSDTEADSAAAALPPACDFKCLAKTLGICIFVKSGIMLFEDIGGLIQHEVFSDIKYCMVLDDSQVPHDIQLNDKMAMNDVVNSGAVIADDLVSNDSDYEQDGSDADQDDDDAVFSAAQAIDPVPVVDRSAQRRDVGRMITDCNTMITVVTVTKAKLNTFARKNTSLGQMHAGLVLLNKELAETLKELKNANKPSVKLTDAVLQALSTRLENVVSLYDMWSIVIPVADILVTLHQRDAKIEAKKALIAKDRAELKARAKKGPVDLAEWDRIAQDEKALAAKIAKNVVPQEVSEFIFHVSKLIVAACLIKPANNLSDVTRFLKRTANAVSCFMGSSNIEEKLGMVHSDASDLVPTPYRTSKAILKALDVFKPAMDSFQIVGDDERVRTLCECAHGLLLSIWQTTTRRSEFAQQLSAASAPAKRLKARGHDANDQLETSTSLSGTPSLEFARASDLVTAGITENAVHRIYATLSEERPSRFELSALTECPYIDTIAVATLMEQFEYVGVVGMTIVSYDQINEVPFPPYAKQFMLSMFADAVQFLRGNAKAFMNALTPKVLATWTAYGNDNPLDDVDNPPDYVDYNLAQAYSLLLRACTHHWCHRFRPRCEELAVIDSTDFTHPCLGLSLSALMFTAMSLKLVYARINIPRHLRRSLVPLAAVGTGTRASIDFYWPGKKRPWKIPPVFVEGIGFTDTSQYTGRRQNTPVGVKWRRGDFHYDALFRDSPGHTIAVFDSDDDDDDDDDNGGDDNDTVITRAEHTADGFTLEMENEKHMVNLESVRAAMKTVDNSNAVPATPAQIDYRRKVLYSLNKEIRLAKKALEKMRSSKARSHAIQDAKRQIDILALRAEATRARLLELTGAKRITEEGYVVAHDDRVYDAAGEEIVWDEAEGWVKADQPAADEPIVNDPSQAGVLPPADDNDDDVTMALRVAFRV